MGWTAAQWLEKRRSQGVERQDDRQTYIPAHIYEQGLELTLMMRVSTLEWPPELFSKEDPTRCSCGCMVRHNNAVSRVVGEAGHRRVVWYASLRCRNKDSPRWE